MVLDAPGALVGAEIARREMGARAREPPAPGFGVCWSRGRTRPNLSLDDHLVCILGPNRAVDHAWGSGHAPRCDLIAADITPLPRGLRAPRGVGPQTRIWRQPRRAILSGQDPIYGVPVALRRAQLARGRAERTVGTLPRRAWASGREKYSEQPKFRNGHFQRFKL